MHWNVCGNGRVVVAVVLVAAVLLGCRARNEQGDPEQTIVIRDAQRLPELGHGEPVDRLPNRIEIVVTEPREDAHAAGASPLASLVGRSVKVQFRRDALGLSTTANVPIPLTSAGSGGRAVSLVGTVRSAKGGWLVLERDGNAYWIPQAAILLIESSDAPTTSPSVK